MPDQHYNTGDGLTRVQQDSQRPTQRMTSAEAEAVLTLVRGGWLKLELTVGRD